MQERIIIKNARQNNLKGVDLSIPRNRLVVFTGLSGSGKSSLAFDTIYAEGQRRYVESMSSYARQFLGQMEKPEVDSIEGLSPAISIDQKSTSRNPRSTVGTVTEIYDHLRLLYARVGQPHCPQCGREITQQTIDEMVDAVLSLPEGTKVMLLSPVVRKKKGTHQKLLENARKEGFARIRADGEIFELDDPPELDKNKPHYIDIVVDRLVIRDGIRQRMTDSMETAARKSAGLVICLNVTDHNETLYSQNYACPECGISLEELSPRMFSFNSPFGACPYCSGLGEIMKISPELIITDGSKSLNEGVISCMGWNSGDQGSTAHTVFSALAEHYGFSMDEPYDALSEPVKHLLLYGSGGEKFPVRFGSGSSSGLYHTDYEGLIPTLERRYRETQSDGMKEYYENFMSSEPCPECGGRRLRKEVLAVTIGGKNIAQVCEMDIRSCRSFFAGLRFSPGQKIIADQIFKEMFSKLDFLCDVGLEYLTLARHAASLSGGEAQRIRLATQIGSGLMGVLYILDEPSIGLHQRDNSRLLDTMRHLRDLGNTLIVVEHDEETLRAADYLVDIGPGAGEHGGYIVAQGSVEDLIKTPASVTGQYLGGMKSIPMPVSRRIPTGFLQVIGAREHNLKNINVSFPLGVFCCVTGVSGSGKSSLVNGILYQNLAHVLNRARYKKADYDSVEGTEQLDKIISIDQSPIGRTPRSNPATYTGLFDLIRQVFAQLPEAKARGYRENRFSFNVKGGRCEACGGDGLLRIEMNFLPDIFVPCEVCGGKRYNRETLEVRFHGLSIAQILDLTVEEALQEFENFPRIRNKLQTLFDVGLGYMRLGQSSTTLSGGEAQRVKLATELSRRATGKTMILLDEPSTGLHMDDVARLIRILQRLTDAGNTVLVIEHNMDIIKTADYIIDLGPEGGQAGGTVTVQGTPEEVADCPDSYTGQYLRRYLHRE